MNVPLDSCVSKDYPEIQKQAIALKGWDVKPEELNEPNDTDSNDIDPNNIDPNENSKDK